MFNMMIYFFVSGIAFYIGVAAIIAVCFISLSSKGVAKRISPYVIAIGIFMMVFSATPISIWYYIIGLLGAAIFAILKYKKSEFAVLFYTFALLWGFAGFGYEWQYFKNPTITGEYNKIYVIGDSVSEGIGQEQSPWPALLGKKYNVNVINLASSGATAETAFKQVKQIKPGEAIIILEIGGNDLLGGTTNKQFEADLDKLLGALTSKDKKIVMFELPLLPNKVAYGSIQRRLAKKYNAALIPKRYFADIITSHGETVDNIHLSDAGHKHMADTVWVLIGNSIKI